MTGPDLFIESMLWERRKERERGKKEGKERKKKRRISRIRKMWAISPLNILASKK